MITAKTMLLFQWTFLETLEGAGVLSPSVTYGHAGNYCGFIYFILYILLLLTNVHIHSLTCIIFAAV